MTSFAAAIAGLILLRVPLSFALLLGSLIFLTLERKINPIVLPQTMFAGLDSFILLAVPLFLLAGNVMSATSMTARLTDCVSAWIGHIRGGFAQVAILTNVVMAGMSGSATADAAATSSVLVPAMRRSGYGAPFSAALISAAATVGPIIPPSIIMLVYASLASVSVAELFLAGVVPGLMVSGFLMVYAHWHARRHDLASPQATSWRRRWRLSWRASPAVLMPVIVIGGIIGGVFTPTEASAVAVGYAVLVGVIGLRELDRSLCGRVLRETAATTGVVMLMVAAANSVSWILIVSGAGDAVVGAFEPLRDHTWAVLALINVVFLLLGAILEPIPLMMLLLPVLLPLVKSAGVDLVHFGVVVTLNTTIGLVTPPVGASMFVAARIAGISIERYARAILPLLAVLLLALLVVTYIPSLSLWLPELLR